VTIAELGRAGPPGKNSEGYFRFLCPRCGEMRATVNPRNNLAHCFACAHNLNNIDLLLTLDYDFRAAVALMERWLKQYQVSVRRTTAGLVLCARVYVRDFGLLRGHSQPRK
jgi:hypothetical protein